MKLKSAKNIQLTKRFVLPITTKEKIIDLVMQGFLEILDMVFSFYLKATVLYVLVTDRSSVLLFCPNRTEQVN